MHPELLVDAIVRQTTVLLAQLSTAAGLRTPLAQVADLVFLDLAREIEAQGVSKKVAADMLGLALRSYQSKVIRLTETVRAKHRTLWEAVFSLVLEQTELERSSILSHFEREDPALLGAILNDLTGSGLLIKSEQQGTTRYRAPKVSDELLREDHEAQQRARAALVWVAVYRGASSEEEAEKMVGLSLPQVQSAIDLLTSEGRLQLDEHGKLTTGFVHLPVGASVGWEAAVFDHFQAVVLSIVRKLGTGQTRSLAEDTCGGGTLTFELSHDHPMRDEVLGLLARVRAETNQLWERVGSYNQAHPLPPERDTVAFYFGQSAQFGSSTPDDE